MININKPTKYYKYNTGNIELRYNNDMESNLNNFKDIIVISFKKYSTKRIKEIIKGKEKANIYINYEYGLVLIYV